MEKYERHATAIAGRGEGGHGAGERRGQTRAFSPVARDHAATTGEGHSDRWTNPLHGVASGKSPSRSCVRPGTVLSCTLAIPDPVRPVPSQRLFIY